MRPCSILVVAAALVVLTRGGDPCWSPATDSKPVVRKPEVQAQLAAHRAVRWLLEQQRPDGGWGSPQYAVLRSGQAYTPFVLHAVLSLSPKLGEAPKASIEKALAFIRSRVSEEGALGYQDPDLLEYPVYATSYAIRALAIASPKDPLLEKMARWLAAMQLAEPKGFEPASPAYGGWNFGVRTLEPGSPGHMDLAHTRRALEALRDAGALPDEVKVRALRFLGLVQKRSGEIGRFPGVPGFEDVHGKIPFDGGFFFSPIVLAANKALYEKPSADRAAYFRSYATATADGALALLAAGVPKTDERVKGALRWLAEHADVAPQGIPADHPEPWVDALRFYHLAAFAEAASALDLPGGWRATFAKRIVELQRPDGSFTNDASPLMKEDDPILATTFALVALSKI